ncbi:MAG: FprA family A-type flavoprotein [Clostridiaceae bacterium]|jgi:flavorubredoxin|nr:FprA family A-type flavoprotein [Clostridiaceae bacterium]
MTIQMITDRVTQVGAIDPKLEYFDCLMPTPYGTTYNSFLIEGDEKTALVDLVQEDTVDQLLENLRDKNIKHLDYILFLHAEQDHSGSASILIDLYPKAQIVATDKVADFLKALLHIPKEDIMIVAEGDTLDLGGVTLECVPVPFAHWPDNTMFWMPEECILFSSDLYGSHYSPDIPSKPDQTIRLHESRTYFSEIMMPFRGHVARYVEKTRQLDPAIICSAHGPVWFEPETILCEYERMVSDKVTRNAVIAYVTMHGSTGRLVNVIAEVLSGEGIEVALVDLGAAKHDLRVPIGMILTESVYAGALILASPAVLGGAHPLAAAMTMLIGGLNPPLRYFGIAGTYGWGSQMVKQLEGLMGRHKAERLEPLLILGRPTKEDEIKIRAYALDLAERLKALPEEDILQDC